MTTVFLKCPRCLSFTYVESYISSSRCDEIELKNAPEDIQLSTVGTHSCVRCNGKFSINSVDGVIIVSRHVNTSFYSLYEKYGYPLKVV